MASRLSAGWARRVVINTPRRLPTGGTAGCQPALRAADWQSAVPQVVNLRCIVPCKIAQARLREVHGMEVFFKNLTGEEVSIEKLVEDLTVLAQDVEDLVKVSSANLGEESKEQLVTAIQCVKARCESLKTQAVAGAKATDRAIRMHPYTSLGIAVGVGFVLGALV